MSDIVRKKSTFQSTACFLWMWGEGWGAFAVLWINPAASQASGCWSLLKECLKIIGISLNPYLSKWEKHYICVWIQICPTFCACDAHFWFYYSALNFLEPTVKHLVSQPTPPLTSPGKAPHYTVLSHKDLLLKWTHQPETQRMNHALSWFTSYTVQLGQHWQLAPCEEIIFIEI